MKNLVQSKIPSAQVKGPINQVKYLQQIWQLIFLTHKEFSQINKGNLKQKKWEGIKYISQRINTTDQ